MSAFIDIAKQQSLDWARRREEFIRQELKAMKTHRFNVWLEIGEMRVDPDPGDYLVRQAPYQIQITQEMCLRRYRPVGWVMPLP